MASGGTDVVASDWADVVSSDGPANAVASNEADVTASDGVEAVP